jgi:hypothetical protein
LLKKDQTFFKQGLTFFVGDGWKSLRVEELMDFESLYAGGGTALQNIV